MPEPTVPPTSNTAFGVRGQPSGTLGGVDHIQNHVDIGVYLAWLKSVDVTLQAAINAVSAANATNAGNISSVSASLAALDASITTEETWASWAGPVIYSTVGSVSLGTGGSTVAIYKHQGYDVECDFVVTLGTGFSLGTSGGLQRINLPVAADSFYATNEGVVGYGHLHDKSGFTAGTGPHQVWSLQFHAASGLTASQAGILVMTGNTSDTHFNNLLVGSYPYSPAAGDKFVGKLKYKAASHS